MDTDNSNKGLSIVKIIASVLFISLPLLGFYVGINYQKSIVNSDISEVNELPLKNINKNNQITTQTIPTPNADETANWKMYEGRSGYASNETDPQKGKFTIYYPKTCDEEFLNKEIKNINKIIKCTSKLSIYTINPQAGDHGAEIIKKDTIILNNIKWDRTLFKSGNSNTSLGASYGTEINKIYQLIEVGYDNYSDKTQTEVEKIIATFQAS